MREYRVILPSGIYQYRHYTDRSAGLKEAEAEFGHVTDVTLHTAEYKANEHKMYFIGRAISNITKYLHKQARHKEKIK